LNHYEYQGGDCGETRIEEDHEILCKKNGQDPMERDV